MIAACPKCSTRYRVDPEKLGPDGARLRCTQCEAVFRVRAPEPPAAPAQIPVAPAIEASMPATPQPAPETPVDSARAVLVADPDVASGKRTAAAIASWGLQPLLVHDGVEAILAIQRNLPAAAVVDAALPKMFGFQICEMVKRNESLRGIHVVLVGTIHHADRYRRPPSELYGADAYLEQPELPNGLAPLLERFGLTPGAPLSLDTPAPAPAAAPAPEPLAAAPPPQSVAPAPPAPVVAEPPRAAPTAAEAAPVANDPRAEERAKAERLARIIVSDIVLYHPEKFEAAIRAGNLEQALQSDLAEGRSLFDQRIDEDVRSERDFLLEELNRVALERSQ